MLDPPSGNLRFANAGHNLPFKVVAELLAQLADFTGVGWEQEDDVTFVVVYNEV